MQLRPVRTMSELRDTGTESDAFSDMGGDSGY
jgi:hypothetical protein